MTTTKLLANWRDLLKILAADARLRLPAQEFRDGKIEVLDACIEELQACLDTEKAARKPARKPAPRTAKLVDKTLGAMTAVFYHHKDVHKETCLRFKRVTGYVRRDTGGCLSIVPATRHRQTTLGELDDAARALERALIAKIPKELEGWQFRFVDGYPQQLEAVSPCRWL